MTLHTRLFRIAASTGAVAIAGASALAIAASASSQAVPSPASHAHAQAATVASKSAGCHVTQHQSIGSPHPTTIRFVNHHNGAVGVYWLSYTGWLVYYETINRHASVVQHTARKSVWVMLNSSFSCVGYVVVSGQPKYVIG